MSNTTGATFGAGSAYLSGAPDITPPLNVVSCVLLLVCLSFFIFSHGVVSLFSIYEFDRYYGIVSPSCYLKYILKLVLLEQ